MSPAMYEVNNQHLVSYQEVTPATGCIASILHTVRFRPKVEAMLLYMLSTLFT